MRKKYLSYLLILIVLLTSSCSNNIDNSRKLDYLDYVKKYPQSNISLFYEGNEDYISSDNLDIRVKPVVLAANDINGNILYTATVTLQVVANRFRDYDLKDSFSLASDTQDILNLGYAFSYVAVKENLEVKEMSRTLFLEDTSVEDANKKVMDLLKDLKLRFGNQNHHIDMELPQLNIVYENRNFLSEEEMQIYYIALGNY